MNAKGRQSDFIRANSYYYAQEFRSLQIFAPGSGTGFPPVCFWSATVSTFAAIHGRDARATTFWLPLHRAESIRDFKTIIASRRFLAFY